MKKINVVKFINYCFQHEYQLSQAMDDSNTFNGLDSEKFNLFLIGRLNIPNARAIYLESHVVVFLPISWSWKEVAEGISNVVNPDIFHFHGNHSWLHSTDYASFFKLRECKLIFSPAGSSCGNPEFLSKFDWIIVNHYLQIDRMKTSDKSNILVRKRCANPEIFKPMWEDKIDYHFVYVAGLVPVKRIDLMIETVVTSSEDKTLLIIGESSRDISHADFIKDLISKNNWQHRIKLKGFMPQDELNSLLGRCGVFVWPNIKPENPNTTTNRSVIEALSCGMPLLLGERAFRETQFIRKGVNGWLYSSSAGLNEKADLIFSDINSFRKSSYYLAMEEFSYKKNFIDFYNDLYSR